MNSLIGYGSDDHSDDSGDERFPEMPGKSVNSKTYSRAAPHEDNYEEVGMDMSEDSNDSSNRELSESSKSSRPDKSNHASNSNQRTDRRSSSRSPKQYRGEDRRTQREDRHKIDDRHRRRDARGSRESRDVERNRRDDDKSRDRHERRDRRDERHSRDRRERRRSRSKDRRRSRSPRKSRSPKDSRSRERGSRGFASRKEKADKRMNRLDRLGIEFKPDSYPASALEDAELQSTQGDRFFIPGITGRFRDQIEKRKLLWQKAKEPEESAVKPNTAPVSLSTAAGSKSSKVYEATTFADDKTSNKFKRLMGIKETDTANLPVKGTDVLKKQQEMFSSMEAQYEVARTATHTMRGVGLGFGSLQR